MFIELRLQKVLFAPEEGDISLVKSQVSLLWSETVLFGEVSIDISTLCGEDRFF